MNPLKYRSQAAIVLMVLGFAVTACGVLEIELEPDTATRLPTALATQVGALEEAVEVAETSGDTGDKNTPMATNAELTATPSPTAQPEEVQDKVTDEEQPPSELSRIDDTWNQYTNFGLGFSIKIPSVKMNAFGACEWNEENGDHSFRPRYALVPVTVFEDANTVYITGEYQHVLSGETRETSENGGTRIFYSECEAVLNSLTLLRDPDSYQEMWAIVVEEVQNDQELEAFLRVRYGEGCSLGEKVEAGQAGVFDIHIQGDGKDLTDTACPINFGTVIKYYPVGGKVVAWNTGQAYTFSADINNQVTHDQEMIDSFLFLTGEAGS